MPYDRTLLSKDQLAGEDAGACVALSERPAYADAGIDVRLGVRAVRLPAGESRVELSDGDELAFDRLVVCTGGRPVMPEALVAPGVLALREAADLPRVHDALARVRHLVIIGGGFIGGEVASAAVKRYAPVTLVEAASAPLAPVLGDDVAGRLAGMHRAAGVELVCGTPVRGVRRERDGLGVVLSDGRTLWADAVLVGVGMTPNVEWLEGSGVELDDGVVTDSACRTARPDVLAAGDCARWEHPGYGARLRVEHWDVAMRHGEAVAAAALGSEEPFAPAPLLLVRSARDEAAMGRPRPGVGPRRPLRGRRARLRRPLLRFRAPGRRAHRRPPARMRGGAPRAAVGGRRTGGDVEMTMDVFVDPELCIGSASCIRLAPGAFELDDDGVADVVDPGAAPEDQLRAAARSCPTGAITVDEGAG